MPANLRDVIEFPPNIPVLVRLKFKTGKAIDTAKGPRVLFTCVDDKIFFTDPKFADAIEELRPTPAEPLQITKRVVGKAVNWTVQTVSDAADELFEEPPPPAEPETA